MPRGVIGRLLKTAYLRRPILWMGTRPRADIDLERLRAAKPLELVEPSASSNRPAWRVTAPV